MDEQWNEREHQRVEEAAKRTEQYQRWGISTAPMREPEAQFRAALAPIDAEERHPLTPAQAHAAAVVGSAFRCHVPTL